MKYLNVGCGNRYHPDWINIDISPSSPEVIAYNISRGIPHQNNSCDVVYHSHVLEHLRRNDSLPFMKECFRVLKPGGILRVSTPDLEQMCRIYLNKLEAAMKGDASSAHDYNWIMLEMYDQTVREECGGSMLAYLRQNPLPNESFVYERIGEEGRNIIRNINCSGTNGSCRHRYFHSAFFLKDRSYALSTIRDKVLAPLVFGSAAAEAIKIGQFRLAGEVHQWMYDRYSLRQIMLAAGFMNPIQQSATSSLIPRWMSFNLDSLPDGTVNKPDSLFMEAVKH